MGQFEKLMFSILSGSKDRDIRFDDLCRVLESCGFQSRVKGSHHIYTHDDVQEIINIQPDGSYAKPYQVKQVRQVVVKYRLGGNINA